MRHLLLPLADVGELLLDLLEQTDNPLVRRELLAVSHRHLLFQSERVELTPHERAGSRSERRLSGLALGGQKRRAADDQPCSRSGRAASVIGTEAHTPAQIE